MKGQVAWRITHSTELSAVASKSHFIAYYCKKISVPNIHCFRFWHYTAHIFRSFFSEFRVAKITDGSRMLTSRMIFSDHLLQVLPIEVCVNLRSGDGFMTEHFLHCT